MVQCLFHVSHISHQQENIAVPFYLLSVHRHSIAHKHQCASKQYVLVAVHVCCMTILWAGNEFNLLVHELLAVKYLEASRVKADIAFSRRQKLKFPCIQVLHIVAVWPARSTDQYHLCELQSAHDDLLECVLEDLKI